MVSLVADNIDQIRSLCEKHDVATLWLFGSATGDDFDPASSDIDFVVEFQPQPRRGFDDVYFKFQDDLRELLGREVDLIERHVVERSANPYRRRAILSSMEPVYAAA